MAISKIDPAGLDIGQIGGRRNLIINGAMQVAQRGTSSTGQTSAGYKTCDRFNTFISSAGTWTITQSTDAPDGFSNSIKYDCTTASASLASGARMDHQYRFEGQDLQHLAKGTSEAVSLTLSFWVKSNKTGTYIVELFDNDNSRQISQAYSISASNTWQHKTLTFTGDTSGALGNDNGNSFQVNWFLVAGTNLSSGTLNTSWASSTSANRAVGQVNLADSTDNEWYLTGVQLEVDDTATPFEHRSFGEELALCQRYCFLLANDDDSSEAMPIGVRGFNTDQVECDVIFPTEMRTRPTLLQLGSGTNWRARYATFSVDWTSFTWWTQSSRRGGLLYNGSLSGITIGNYYRLARISGSAYIIFDAEL